MAGFRAQRLNGNAGVALEVSVPTGRSPHDQHGGESHGDNPHDVLIGLSEAANHASDEEGRHKNPGGDIPECKHPLTMGTLTFDCKRAA